MDPFTGHEGTTSEWNMAEDPSAVSRFVVVGAVQTVCGQLARISELLIRTMVHERLAEPWWP